MKIRAALVLVVAFALAAAAVWRRWRGARPRRRFGRPDWEIRLEEQVRRLGERETELEHQVGRLRRQEDALEQQVSALAQQEEQLEEQVEGIGQREKSMQLKIDELADREEQLEGEVAKLRQRESQLETEVRQLRGRESDLESDVAELRERESRLETDVQQATAAWVQADDRAKQFEEDLQSERSRVEHLQQRITDLEERRPADAAHWTSVVPPMNFSELPMKVRRYMPQLVFPDAVLQRAEQLDSNSQRDGWLRSAWRGLGALQEYAATEHDCAGSFWKWCTESGSEHVWLPDRLAMRETDETMARHGEKRIFPVDERVDPSGRIEMQAHLKVDAIGGPDIPRIYFHDDTEGVTGQVHIGFVGPHSLTPTSKF